MKTKAVLLVVVLLLVTVLVSGCIQDQQQDTTKIDGSFTALDQGITGMNSDIGNVLGDEGLSDDITGDLDISF